MTMTGQGQQSIRLLGTSEVEWPQLDSPDAPYANQSFSQPISASDSAVIAPWLEPVGF